MNICQEIYRAIKMEDIARVKVLITEEAVVNCIWHLYPVLTHAVFSGNVELVRLLIQNGADVDMQNEDGYSSLHGAADYNQVQIAGLLIESNALVDIKDQFGNSPLWTAVFLPNYDLAMIELLLRNHANPDSTNNYGLSPRAHALRTESEDILLLFAKYKPTN